MGDGAVGCSLPVEETGAGIDRVEIVVLRADVNGPFEDGRRRGNRATCGKTPFPGAFGSVKGVEVVIAGADVDDAAGNGGGRGDSTACGKVPEQFTGGSVDSVEVVIAGTNVENTFDDSW